MKQGEAGVKTADLCRGHGISAATFYGWTQKFSGLDVSEAQRLHALLERSGANNGEPLNERRVARIRAST